MFIYTPKKCFPFNCFLPKNKKTRMSICLLLDNCKEISFSLRSRQPNKRAEQIIENAKIKMKAKNEEKKMNSSQQTCTAQKWNTHQKDIHDMRF